MDTTERVPFSQLIREPTSVTERLDRSPRGMLRLTRRNRDDLILESGDRARADAETATTATRVFVSLMRTDSGIRELLLALPEIFPWVRFLSTDEVRTFLIDFVRTAEACADINNYVALETEIAAWRHTAEIYADPELHAALTDLPADESDAGPVPAPPADDGAPDES